MPARFVTTSILPAGGQITGEQSAQKVRRKGRSIARRVVRKLRAKGAALECVEQPVDTTTAAGKCFLDMLGVFAEFETNIRKERQMEGIAAAKAAGVYTGRMAVLDPIG